jgi:hypothetical protein
MIFILTLLLENSCLKCSCETGLTTHQHSIKDPNHTYTPYQRKHTSQMITLNNNSIN